jgi:hypothetical protein
MTTPAAPNCPVPVPSEVNLVIHHGDCPDGFGAAFVCGRIGNLVFLALKIVGIVFDSFGLFLL